MAAIMRGRKIRNQYVTSDLDASRLVLTPYKNRHRIQVMAHPDNTAGEVVWVHLVQESAGGGKMVNGAGATIVEDDASADVGGIDATDTNSGVALAAGQSFIDDASGNFVFDGAITAIGSAAGLKLIVLEW